MQYTRETAIARLLDSYQAYYNISLCDDSQKPLRAVCEFFEKSEKFVLSRKAELWSANCEEFIYLYDVEHLTKDIFEKCRDFAHEDGLKRANIGPGHMYTYITPIFVCDSCDKDAIREVKKCHIYKSFKFGLHGWLDVHMSAVILPEKKVIHNASGHTTATVIRKVLFHIKKK